jgi:hypothetical protein
VLQQVVCLMYLVCGVRLMPIIPCTSALWTVLVRGSLMQD